MSETTDIEWTWGIGAQKQEQAVERALKEYVGYQWPVQAQSAWIDDPKAKHLLEQLEGIELPRPTGWHLLCLVYIRPDKVGSLYMPGQTKDEDKYQGRVGLVLEVGPEAYRGERFTAGPWAKAGDWVLWPPVESSVTRFAYRGKDSSKPVVLAMIPDDRIIGVGVDPERWATAG